MKRNRWICIVCSVSVFLTSIASGQPAQETKTDVAQPVPTGYRAVNAAIDFFAILKAHINQDFVDPAVREDAIKDLTLVLSEVNSLISLNRDLQNAVAQEKPDDIRSIATSISDKLNNLDAELDRIVLLVPASDTALASASINVTSRQIGSRGMQIRAVSSDTLVGNQADPAVQAKEAKEAQAALDISYKIRQSVADLIVALNAENTGRHP